MLKIKSFKSQAFPEMPRQLQESSLGPQYGQGVTPPVRVVEKLAPVIGSIKVR